MDNSPNGIHWRNEAWTVKRHENLKNEIRALCSAGVGIWEGRENLVDPQKESGEDFTWRIIEVLKQIRREKLRNREEEDNETEDNGLARVPNPARGENETKTDEKGDCFATSLLVA